MGATSMPIRPSKWCTVKPSSSSITAIRRRQYATRRRGVSASWRSTLLRRSP
jgi:hypothetical protein